MRLIKFCCLPLVLILLGLPAYAVDKSRLWLPKKFTAAMPKLLAAANQAEQSRRCVRVVAGEMLVNKNTPDHYYFVITCKDSQSKTYSLNYHAPVSGADPVLVAEQGRGIGEKLNLAGSDDARQLQQCIKALNLATVGMQVTSVDEAAISPLDLPDSSYAIPFKARNEQAIELDYQAQCKAGQRGKPTITIHLQPAGAKAICQQGLMVEPLLLKALEVTETVSATATSEGGFDVELPFLATNLKGDRRQFKAFCQVSSEAEAEMVVRVDPDVVVAMCRQSIEKATGRMIGVEIVEVPVMTLDEDEGEYSGVFLFDAKSPTGRPLHFQASCQIDDMGRSAVSISSKK